MRRDSSRETDFACAGIARSANLAPWSGEREQPVEAEKTLGEVINHFQADGLPLVEGTEEYRFAKSLCRAGTGPTSVIQYMEKRRGILDHSTGVNQFFAALLPLNDDQMNLMALSGEDHEWTASIMSSALDLRQAEEVAPATRPTRHSL